MKIKLVYDNPKHEQIIDLNPKSKEEASLRCEEIMDSNKKMIDRFEKSNIFVSQKLMYCEVVFD